MGRTGLFDLEKRFAFYGVYHSNPTNVFIHMLVVWPTLFTAHVLFYFTPPLFSLSLTSAINNVLILNVGFFFTLITSLFWVCSEKKAGSLAALLCFMCWVASNYLANHLGFSLAWKIYCYITYAIPIHCYIRSHLFPYLDFTALVLFYFTPPLFSLSLTPAFNNVLILNAGFFFTLITTLFWMCYDKKAGSLAALLCFMCWVASSYLANHLGFFLAWKVVLGTQLISWSGHIAGHRVFEKRAPVLQDNLSLAFLMEPFFVVLEALHLFFQYEPYPGFHAKVSPMIQEEIKDWQEKKRNKVS